MNNKMIIWSILFLTAMGIYYIGEGSVFIEGARIKFASILLVSFTIYYYIERARSGDEIYLRTIPGLKALEEAVGRATEMGKSVLFVPGISDLDQVETITGLNILGHVAEHTAKYETSLNVPVSKSIVMEANASNTTLAPFTNILLDASVIVKVHIRSKILPGVPTPDSIVAPSITFPPATLVTRRIKS